MKKSMNFLLSNLFIFTILVSSIGFPATWAEDKMSNYCRYSENGGIVNENLTPYTPTITPRNHSSVPI